MSEKAAITSFETTGGARIHCIPVEAFPTGPFTFIHLPGHCPGHVAIRLDDVVFCGDMVVEGVTPHLSPESIHPHSGLDHYLESLARLQAWAKDARLIFNGHDDVITDLPAQAAQSCRIVARPADHRREFQSRVWRNRWV